LVRLANLVNGDWYNLRMPPKWVDSQFSGSILKKGDLYEKRNYLGITNLSHRNINGFGIM
jgi:hypothetical protein